MIEIISYLLVSAAFLAFGIGIGQAASPTVHRAVATIDRAENTARTILAKIATHKAS